MSDITEHWQPPEPWPDGPACRAKDFPFLLTVQRDRVTCEACKQSKAWKS